MLATTTTNRNQLERNIRLGRIDSSFIDVPQQRLLREHKPWPQKARNKRQSRCTNGNIRTLPLLRDRIYLVVSTGNTSFIAFTDLTYNVLVSKLFIFASSCSKWAGKFGSGECFKSMARITSVGVDSGRCRRVKTLGGGCIMSLCRSTTECKQRNIRVGDELSRGRK